MAITLDPSIQDTSSIAELLDFCNARVSYTDEASILAASDLLAGLVHDRMLLINAINSKFFRILEAADGDLGLSTQSILMHADAKFKIRANIWKPPAVRGGSTDHDDKIYSYQYAHNHNFQLLTVGYLGSGYATQFYECDPANISGYIGEKVDLRFLEETSLPRGRVILMRSGIDVHTQLPPQEFSVSLNLLVAEPGGAVSEQYNFDLEKSVIAGIIAAPMSSIISVLTFAAMVGSSNNVEPALRIAESNSNWRVRLAAYECSSFLAEGESEGIWNKALRDTHARIRELASAHLEGH
jgi:hypothetical protein